MALRWHAQLEARTHDACKHAVHDTKRRSERVSKSSAPLPARSARWRASVASLSACDIMPRQAERAPQGSMYSAQAAAAAAQSASTAGVGSHAQHVRASMPAARGSLCFFRKTGDRSLARPHVHSFDSAGQERVEYVCCEYQLVVLRSELTRVEVLPVQEHSLHQAQAWPDPARSRGVPCLSEGPFPSHYLPILDKKGGCARRVAAASEGYPS